METAKYSKIHKRLLEFAKTAVATGKTNGLMTYVFRECPGDVVPAVIVWLEMFTPIRCVVRAGTGLTNFFCPRGTDPNFDLSSAKLTPFWGVDPPVSHTAAKQIAPTRAGLGSVSSRCRVTPLSDRQFAEVRLKKAVEMFLTDRTAEGRATIIGIVDELYSSGASGRRSPFLHAGAPGLGKRA